VDLIINERTMQALTDYGAPHNFFKEELASEIELGFGLCIALVKAINSKAKKTCDVIFAIHIHLDKWKRHADFTIL
jgi:hypothetical protein